MRGRTIRLATLKRHRQEPHETQGPERSHCQGNEREEGWPHRTKGEEDQQGGPEKRIEPSLLIRLFDAADELKIHDGDAEDIGVYRSDIPDEPGKHLKLLNIFRPQHRGEDNADRVAQHEPYKAALHVLNPALCGERILVITDGNAGSSRQRLLVHVDLHPWLPPHLSSLLTHQEGGY
jgi:hypothetical protein